MNVSDSESEGDEGVIGPALPPHLQKKRGKGDDKTKRSPKQQQQQQHSAGDIGPALPPTKKSAPIKQYAASDSACDIGPALPPHLLNRSRGTGDDTSPSYEVQLPPDYSRWNTFDADASDKDRAESEGVPGNKPALPDDRVDDEEDDDTYGPALPPGFKKAAPVEDDEKDNGRTTSSVGAGYGPSFPPGMRGNHPAVAYPDDGEGDEEDDDDDDVIGPMPMRPGMEALYARSAAEEFEKRSSDMKKKLSSMNEPEQPKRESWMMELPGYSNNFGLGARTFRKTPIPEAGDRSGWTDTPADRERKERERAEKHRSEERRGKGKKRAEPSQDLSERDKRLSSLVAKHNESSRGLSLVDIHEKKRKKELEEEKDKPQERRPFDRDLDLNVNQFDEAKRKQLIKKSAQLNERFSHSKDKVFL